MILKYAMKGLVRNMENVNLDELIEAPYEPLARKAREVAAEGCVLLKNDGNVLPIKKENVVSLFGRTQIDYYKSGTGSGGLVRTEYVVNILDGMQRCDKINLNEDLIVVYKEWLKENPFDIGGGWAQEAWCQKEMVPDEEVVAEARRKSDVAVIVLGRTAGEDRDNSAQRGSWYLTDEEESLLEIVSRYFEKTAVILNVGNIIDMKWVEKYNIKSVMYVWQGGQDGGNAVADVLCGNVTPSGKLTDTIAKDISLYPSTKNFGDPERNFYAEDIYVGYRYFETFAREDVLYPFGFGLSYTTFKTEVRDVSEADGKISISVNVENIGAYDGKEIIEIYFEAPQGKLGKSVRELCAFSKTGKLAPGEKCTLNISFDVDSMSAYDDSGVTGNKSCCVLEAGEYNIYAGGCVRCAEKVYTHTESKTRITKKLTEAMSPVEEFNIMYPEPADNGYKVGYKKASLRTVDYDKRIKDELPKDILYTGDRGIKLIDVKNGASSMNEFTAQLSDADLMCLVRGEGMCSPKVRPGSAGAIGGVTESLSRLGIPVICVTDGPSGIRMDSGEKATSLPNGTAIACTWEPRLAEELYSMVSIELYTHRIDSLLGPGINIHRSPLNGRNFEYLSEDPYITGKFAAAFVRGMAKYGNSSTIKHFAANSQEFHRRDTDSVMSERAAREIYLKGFEMAVREDGAKTVMTSYNLINNHWSANNYELNTTILRNEWGFKGLVMTDWWPRLSVEKSEKLNLKNLVEAQNDVYMPTSDALTSNDNMPESLAEGSITRGQLQRNAINILEYIMGTHSFERFVKYGGHLEKSLAEDIDKLSVKADYSDVDCGAETELSLAEPGKYLFCVEYTSDEPDISQMVINILVNGVSAASITVNGNNGGKTTVYRDISVAQASGKIKLTYPGILKVTRLTLMK